MPKIMLFLFVCCVWSPLYGNDDDQSLAMLFKDNFSRSNSPDLRYGWIEDEALNDDAVLWGEQVNLSNRLDNQLLSITNKLNHSRGFKADSMWAHFGHLMVDSAYTHQGKPLGRLGFVDLMLSETIDFSDRWIRLRITMEGELILEYLHGKTHLQASKQIYRQADWELWQVDHQALIQTHPLGYEAKIWADNLPQPIAPLLLKTPGYLSPIRFRYVMDDGVDDGSDDDIFRMESFLDDLSVMSNLVDFGDQDESFYYRSQGENRGGRYGHVVAVLDDINQDGKPEYLVGAPNGGDQEEGQVWVHSGLDGSVIYTIQGRQNHEHFGTASAFLGDIDGDGVGDFAVSAPGADQINGSYGRVDIYSGKQGEIISSIYSEQSSRNFGIAMAALADINQDGYQDLAIADSVLQEVVVVSAIDGEVINRIDGNNLVTAGFFGQALAAIKDLNQDGFVDLIVGAPYEGYDPKGAVYAISAIDGQVIYRISGQSEGVFGNHVGVLGDLNNDGWDDFYGSSVLSHEDDIHGDNYTQIISGQNGSRLFSLDHPSSDQDVGASLCGVGDVDQDGCNDFLMGWPGDDYDRGVVHLYSGAHARLLKTYQGRVRGDRFGYFLIPYPDVDGNGDLEFLVSAPSPEDWDAGEVSLFSLRKPLIAPEVSVTTTEAFALFTIRDGNGLPDIDSHQLLVGAQDLSAWLVSCMLSDPQHCQAVLHEDGKGVDLYINEDWRSRVVSFSVCDQDGHCAADDNQ